MEAIQNRFWPRVDKSAGPDGCWLWIAGLGSEGYGRLSVEGHMRYAHRLSLEWASGPCPPGLEACHSCRNRHCVNPAHLRWGSRASNVSDCIADGTSGRGERNPSATLTAAQVLAIRKSVADGEMQTIVARRHGVKARAVNKIVHRQRWKHI